MLTHAERDATLSSCRARCNANSCRARCNANSCRARCNAKLKENDAPAAVIVQELCESRGGRPGLSVLTSLLVSVDVKIY